ncbi:hypothetical protein [Klebsiella pneumoniae]|uniref:hypothetical protein n=1 Tax=Klebsiella pneumoniae TaxID=573 RepID=UPI0022479486|nr:hypothetical protein [Klebsiella pneumoniae]MCW9308144.1 hypothetical protein [Klebsiella pneumoniae]MCW9317062.1 hypothetical protein [Klebsiella pneumoniae]
MKKRLSSLGIQGKQKMVSFLKKTSLLVCAVLISNVAFAVDNKEEIAPVHIGCPTPAMPVKAQALRTEGRVDYAAWVNDKGEVYSVDKTGDEVFFRETEVAIKKCKFVPGHPGVYRDTIKFSLVKP